MRLGNDGKGNRGRLPPVVSSLFSIKAAHWSDAIRGTELGARGKERTARTPRYPRKRLRLTRWGIEHEEEDEGPNVYNCASPTERQAGALALQWDFRLSIHLTPCSTLHAPRSMLLALCPSRPGDEAELVVLL